MKWKIRDEASGARGGRYRFVNPEDNFLIEHLHVQEVIKRARDYRRLNNFPIGTQWEDDVIQNICAHTPEPSCVPENGAPSLIQRAAAFAASTAQWVKSGMPIRTQEESERIWGICQSCEHYNGKRGLFKIACKRCGCAGVKISMANTHCIIGKW